MKKVLFILGQLGDRDVDWITNAGHKEQVSAGTVLIRQGQPVDYLYIVLDGLLSVTDSRLEDRELAQLGAGEMVGEMSFIDAAPPGATVTALQDSTVLAIPRVQLSHKLAQDPRFAAHFYRAIATFLSDRLRATVGQLGYGDGAAPDEEAIAVDELDDNVLDNIHLAGDRFERMLQQFMRR
ncbi:MAG: cyclic nucleotide-binding domain-containing protein [Anaerolineae bacterium]|nr:cyclic nucleotide-binding domain-containing protein [Anaerolineae bacterium]